METYAVRRGILLVGTLGGGGIRLDSAPDSASSSEPESRLRLQL